MSDQWPRAHLRAALREVGYDAVGTRDLQNALRIPPVAADRGPVRLVVVDQHVLHADAEERLRDVRECFADPRFLLVASATSAHPAGEWERVVTRPLSVADLVSAVQALLPLPEELRRPLD
jgi:hypothetical protein